MSIYKAYDIRGVYPDELNEKTAYGVGRAFAVLLQSENPGEDLEIVVGRDMRGSGDSLTAEVIKGLREGGLDIAYVGLVSTPTFYFAVAKYGYAGGLMVSASHNPAEYNGFKLVRARAVPVGGETGIKDIEAMVLSGAYPKGDRMGALSEKKGVLEDQVSHDLRFADVQKIKSLKIVADAANGMGSLYLDELFKHLPCDLVKMYFDLDGRFPNHEADPLKEENKEALKQRVIAEKADLGIATDGDGDRIFFVDDKGESIDPAIIRGILARIFLREKPGATIGYDIRPGRITKDMIEENGGKPLVTRVGHSLIKQAVIDEGAYFAGESSGHFFLSLDHGVYEVPLIVTLKLLQEFSVSGMSASEYVRPLKRYFHSGEINMRVRDVAETIETIAKKYSDGTQSRLDGITVEYSDFWFNVRGSNTEPLIRLNLEAKSQEVMEQKRNEVLRLIRSYS
ncbi:MAG: phosphomannomutase/phosphoglucomutase [Patescibacteria group bacterium]